jgi:hypothetical protein
MIDVEVRILDDDSKVEEFPGVFETEIDTDDVMDEMDYKSEEPFSEDAGDGIYFTVNGIKMLMSYNQARCMPKDIWEKAEIHEGL